MSQLSPSQSATTWHSPKQLLIGLDAMEWTLVQRWANERKLPAFRGLLERCARGRDRRGLVTAGAEYCQARQAIAAGLEGLRDPHTGRKVAKQITFTQDAFDGPFRDHLPDLTVLWDQDFAWDEIESPVIGRLKIRKQDARSGSHSARGFLLTSGYGGAPGEEYPPAHLCDIAPTVLRAARVETSSAMDGRALFSLQTA